MPGGPVLALLITAALLYMAKAVGPALWPLGLAILLSWIVQPLARRFSRAVGPRLGTLAVTMLVGALGLAGLLLVLHEMWRQALLAAGSWPVYQGVLLGDLSRLAARHQPWLARLLPLIRRLLPAGGGGAALLARILGGLWQVAGGIPALLLNLLFSLAGAYFLSVEGPRLRLFLLGLLPEGWRALAQRIGEGLYRTFFTLVLGELAAALYTTAVSVAGLYLLGQRYALLLGLLAGLLDLLPIIGPTMFFFPWALGLFASGQPGSALGLLGLLGVVGLGRQLVEAKLVGRGMNLHPFLVWSSVYLGWRYAGAAGFLWGPFGLFLGRVVLEEFGAVS